jgi:hypothetical protein
MVYYGFRQRPPILQPIGRLEWRLTLVLALLIGSAVMSGRIRMDPDAANQHPLHQVEGQWWFSLQTKPDHYGAFLPGKRHPQFYVLPPWAGMLLMLVIVGLYSAYPNPRFHDQFRRYPPTTPVNADSPSRSQ